MNPIDLLADPDALRRVQQRARSLSKFRVVLNVNGTPIVCPLQIAATGGVIQGAFNIETDEDEDALNWETVIWRDRAIDAGGTFGAESIALADALIIAIHAETFNAKIKYLLPLLGSNLATARVPLRDSLGVGIATNNGFVDGDYSEATGLQGNNADTLDTLVDVQAIGSSSNGGMGYWERNVSANAGEAIGARVPGVRLWQIYLDPATPRELAYWGNGSGAFETTDAPGNHHYYLQRASATDRILYRNAVNVASSVVNDATLTGTANFFVLGVDTSFVGEGRCGVAYLTDGTMTAAEITAFHNLLQTYLITPTGR